MSLIYNPNSIYMTPRNTAADSSGGLNMSFLFNGSKLNELTYDLAYATKEDGWVFFLENENVPLSKPYYNQEIVEFNSSAIFSDYNNSQCGWRVNVFGEEKDLIDVSGVSDRYQNKYSGLNSGDSMYLKNPVNKNIKNKDLYWDIFFNALNPTEFSWLAKIDDNLVNVGGDIKVSTSGTIDGSVEGISIPLDTKRRNNGVDTDIVFEKDKIYKMVVIYEENYSTSRVDFLELDTSKIFSQSDIAPQILSKEYSNGTTSGKAMVTIMFKYSIDISKESLKNLTLSLKPVTGREVITIPNNQVFAIVSIFDAVLEHQVFAEVDFKYIRFHYNKEGSLQSSLEDIVPSSYIGVGNTSKPFARSQIIPFTPINPANILLNVPSPLGDIKYVFKPTFISEYMPVIERWSAKLYDENGNVLEETIEFYDSNVEKTFSTSILDGNTYYVSFDCYDVNGYRYYVDSNRFLAEYESIAIFYNPTAEFDCKNTHMKVDWSGLVDIESVLVGSGNFEDNFGGLGINGYSIDENSSLTYYVDIPRETPPSFLWSPNDDVFDGEIFRLEDDAGGYASILYDRIEGEFSLRIRTFNGGEESFYDEVISIYDNILSSDVFVIGFYGEDGYVRKI